MPAFEALKNLVQQVGNALRRQGMDQEIPDSPTTETSEGYEREWREAMGISPTRSASYRDYRLMENESPVVSAALDCVADAAIAGADGDSTNVYEVQFPEDETGTQFAGPKKILDDLEARLGCRDEAWGIIRAFLHMGDDFSEVVIDPAEMQIVRLKPLVAESIVIVPEWLEELREHGVYVQYDEEGREVARFSSWQMVHFHQKVNRTGLYGKSMLGSARRTFKQLQMIEDSMVINRLKRATMRYVHKVPTGKLGPEDALKFIKKYKMLYNRFRRFDSDGKMILGTAPMTEEGDFYVPNGEVTQGDVTAIQGQAGMDRISDVEYFQNALFSALGTPKSYLGFEQNTAGKNVITTLDVRFARLVRRAQTTHGTGQRQIYDTELALHKIDPRKLEYKLIYPSLGTVDQVRVWQIELLKAQVAKMLKIDAKLIQDDEYLLRKIVEVEDSDDIAKIIKANEKANAEAEAKQQEMMAAKAAGSTTAGPKLPSIEAKEPALEHLQRGPFKQRVHAAVDHLLTRSGCGSFLMDLNEIYGLSKPMVVTAPPSKVAVELLEELKV